MHRSKIIPDVVTYSSLIDGLCKSGRIEYALELVDEMRCREVIPNVVTYNSLINCLCKSGRIKYALELVDEMRCRKIIPDVVTYNSLIDGGRMEDARKVFEDLLVKGYDLNVYTYTVMIKGFCNDGLFDEALTMNDKLKIVLLRPELYTTGTSLALHLSE
ncbi:pentatricopeptide repeat-containing protein, partial [Trifolium pratense]